MRLPERLPGIPKLTLAHCRNEAKAIIDSHADELDGLDLETKACLDLKLQEDCLERMHKVAQAKAKKTASVDPFFYRFGGAWDMDSFDDSMETFNTLAREGVCRSKGAALEAMNAAQGILGVGVGSGAYDWENRGQGATGLNRCAESGC